MKITAAYFSNMEILVGTLFMLLIAAAAAAPLDSDEEQPENSLMGRADDDGGAGWDDIDVAALRKILMQLDAQDRMSRVSRSWPAAPRGWARAVDARPRPWRTDKRQVRFRQCYFNPISCFRK